MENCPFNHHLCQFTYFMVVFQARHPVDLQYFLLLVPAMIEPSLGRTPREDDS